MWEQPLFQADQKHQRELQSFGSMQGHQCDARALVVIVGFADQRRVIEELIKRLTTVTRVHGRVHQFAQVLDAGQRLGRVFLLELLDVAGAVEQELQQLGR